MALPNDDRSDWILGQGEEADNFSEINSPRLFSKSSSEYQVITVSGEGKVARHDVHDTDPLSQGPLEQDRSTAQSVFYIIKQNHSWAPLNISFPSFRELLIRNKVHTIYLRFLQSFGFRKNDDDRIREGVHRGCLIHSDQTFGSRCENLTGNFVCYNLRYVEENGRSRGDPWSVRQMSVYQSYDTQTQKTMWIIIQPSSRILCDIVRNVESLAARAEIGLTIGDCHVIHASWLLSTEKDECAYIDHLCSTLWQLEEKACFSNIGNSIKARSHDFKLTFGDRQQLHLLQNKFRRFESMLRSKLSIIEDCQLSAQLTLGVDSELNTRLIMLRTLTEHRTRRLSSFISRSEGVAEMISTALQFRNQEALAVTNQGMQENLSMLRHLSLHIQQDQNQIRQVTTQGHQESKSVRALTMIATMYLPANLIAQIFSSNLLQFRNDAADALSGHFALVPQFWIFCLTTFVLAFITWATKTLLEKRM